MTQEGVEPYTWHVFNCIFICFSGVLSAGVHVVINNRRLYIYIYNAACSHTNIATFVVSSQHCAWRRFGGACLRCRSSCVGWRRSPPYRWRFAIIFDAASWVVCSTNTSGRWCVVCIGSCVHVCNWLSSVFTRSCFVGWWWWCRYLDCGVIIGLIPPVLV